ncbi:hypothetical protein [Hymenobacter cavernae]|uniref:hypothetical protein n=1 Tax=Hymenobacter cavernae TaxID=2044852 RepID=UPI00166AF792|nr:hypothetical protein [Hymenobacter cavernae]
MAAIEYLNLLQLLAVIIMSRSTFLVILLLVLVVAGCQSTRSIATFPKVREYGRHSTPLPMDSVNNAEPILTAALPGIENLALVQPKKRSVNLGSALVAPTLTPLKLPADTLKKAVPPTVSGKPDPATTVVNVIGGAMAVTGVGVMIASSNADTGGEWGGLADAIGGFMGLILTIAGVTLLFFQGKNGRLRRLREARRAARNPVTPGTEQGLATPPDVTKPTTTRRQRSRAGGHLVIAAGLLALLSLFAGFLIIILLPASLILLLLGLSLMIAGQ